MDVNAEVITLGKVLLAMILGSVIGIERTLAEKPAGLRTYMLVGGASALLTFLGEVIIRTYISELPNANVIADPVRVIQAIIVGISFLGAGTIFRHREDEQVEGLTTAAGILFTAGVGAAVALDRYILAIGGTVLILLVLLVLGRFQSRFFG